MAVLIQCSQCSRKLRVQDDLIGKAIKCPACATKFIAQPVQTPEPATIAVPASPATSPLPATPAKPVQPVPETDPGPINIEPEDLIEPPSSRSSRRLPKEDPDEVEVMPTRRGR